MSNVKERIIGAVTIMNENDAEKIWNLIQATFTLGNAPQDEPDVDEASIMEAYKKGDPDFIPMYSHENVLQELGFDFKK